MFTFLDMFLLSFRAKPEPKAKVPAGDERVEIEAEEESPVSEKPSSIFSSSATEDSLPSTPLTPLSPSTPITSSSLVPPRPIPSAHKDESAIPELHNPYTPSRATEDVSAVSHILHLYLSGKMSRAELLCSSLDPHSERMYICMARACIHLLKAAMSLDVADIARATDVARHATIVAGRHRKTQPSVGARLASYLSSSTATTEEFYRGMSRMELHAELVYAESLCMKSLLRCLSTGNVITFAEESMNAKQFTAIYHSLYTLLQSRTPASDDEDDKHLRSGVNFGLGLLNIALSMLPTRVQSALEFLGYKGDGRERGLEMLMEGGAWFGLEKRIEGEGIRSPICDFALMAFHVMLASSTHHCVNFGFGERVLGANLERYPDGPIYHLIQGIIHMKRSCPTSALTTFQRALTLTQEEYPSLAHACWQEICLAHLALGDTKECEQWFRMLAKEATWSRAVYCYGVVVCLLDEGGNDSKREIEGLAKAVPGMRQRIAGQSIPLEKFVARKSSKLLASPSLSHGLPFALAELAYFTNALEHAPPAVLRGRFLPVVEDRLRNLMDGTGEDKRNWNDICLSKFLLGVCERFVAYPDKYAVLDEESQTIVHAQRRSVTERAKEAFEYAIKHSRKIDHDHWVVYYSHYELARLLVHTGSLNEAKKHLKLLASGKRLEVAKVKGKYSMETALMTRVGAALEELEELMGVDKSG